MTTLADKPDYSLYSNAFGYLRQPLDFKPLESDADVVVIGLPFDMAVTGRSGGRMGPGAIRNASTNLAWEEKRWPWDFSLSEYIKIVDAGDLVFNCGDAADFTERTENFARKVLASGKTLLSFGGDHFVTLPLLRAHHKQFGKMALLHFDAHTDTYSEGSKFDHGTMFYHAPNEGLIDPAHSVQVGIRTEYTKEGHGFQVIDAAMANDMTADEIVAQIKARVGDMPLYVTFDIDCLDPAFAPGTGTPVCGGLTSDKALKIIRGLKGLNIVGMDVVEVAPAYDSADITALAGATLGLEMLHVWALCQGKVK
ncbi:MULTISPECIES: agmatinase [Shewanella]|jgi:agmatinase|uniref:Agmatinase n=1 Tax=Shewanella chilikensis TaxID=558541 RepID=A0A6G7LRM9_9GAMM|nr:MULTISPECIES: agmatinase [Shewanella]MBO2577859.1 agmatinase [Shewanella algae]MBO2685020.1 agmatinase [Shewanella algae]MCA0950510.1 agmatinase [Shewanella chilikensis]MCE9789376.1 agmatinase [Shewanella chilikensis]MCE9852625.1 agmatinase [Shewanella chilikensis]